MPAQLLNGKHLAQAGRQRLRQRIKELVASHGRRPGLAVVLIGNDAASELYVARKEAACAEVGLHSSVHRLPGSVSAQSLQELIETLNTSPEIDGILIQQPLPLTLPTQQFVTAIRPDKDVDGFHPFNIGCLALRHPHLRPCTPAGIMQLLAETGVECRGLNMVIVGASNIVGRPLALEALLAGCTITLCHRFTTDLAACVRRSDCVVAAVGKPNMIPGHWIKEGAIVIDVGINRLPSGDVVGDVDFAGALERAAWITPVPGGVGPMTILKLLENTLLAYETRLNNQ